MDVLSSPFGLNRWYGSRWSRQNLLGFRRGLRLGHFRFWCGFGLWFLSWPFSLFLAGSPLLSFFSGRFVFGLSTSSSKVFLLFKLPLSLLQLFWSWIHQRHVPADMIHPLTSLSRWSCSLWFLRFRCRWWSFRLWFGLLQPFRYSWWSLSSGSQCHWARDSSPCPRFGLRLCYNWSCESMHWWSLTGIRHKVSKPRRSRRLGKPLQHLQSQQCPVHVPVQRLPGLQHFAVDSWILGLLPIQLHHAKHEPQLTLQYWGGLWSSQHVVRPPPLVLRTLFHLPIWVDRLGS